MIQPEPELARSLQAFYVTGIYHALTTTQDRNKLKRRIYAAAFLGLHWYWNQIVSFYIDSRTMRRFPNNSKIQINAAFLPSVGSLPRLE